MLYQFQLENVYVTCLLVTDVTVWMLFSADKESLDGSNEDKWSFDGTVRHLPQGMVPGENGLVPTASVTPPVQQQQLSMPSPSSSSSSIEQLPQQKLQQQNHIEQVLTMLANSCGILIFILTS